MNDVNNYFFHTSEHNCEHKENGDSKKSVMYNNFTLIVKIR